MTYIYPIKSSQMSLVLRTTKRQKFINELKVHAMRAQDHPPYADCSEIKQWVMDIAGAWHQSSETERRNLKNLLRLFGLIGGSTTLKRARAILMTLAPYEDREQAKEAAIKLATRYNRMNDYQRNMISRLTIQHGPSHTYWLLKQGWKVVEERYWRLTPF